MLLQDEKSEIEYGVYLNTANVLLSKYNLKINEVTEEIRLNPRKGIMRFIESNSRKINILPETFWKNVTSFIIVNGLPGLVKEYANVKSVRDSLNLTLFKKLNISLKGNSNLVDELMPEFMKFFYIKTLDKLKWNDGTIEDMIITSFGFFCSEKAELIYKITNERGTAVSTLTGEHSLAGLLEAKVEGNENIKIDFRELIKNIYEGTALMFTSNGEIYQDLFTVCVILEDKKNAEFLNTKIKNVFFNTNTMSSTKSILENSVLFPTMKVIDINLEVGVTYRINSYKLRQEVCKFILESLDNGSLEGSKLKEVFNRVFAIDLQKRSDKNTSNIFKDDSDVGFNIFLKILKGIIASNTVIQYCKLNNIDYRSIPSELFRTDRYGKRFNSLEDFLSSYKLTKSLIERGANSFTNGLQLADELYENLLKKGNITHNFKSIIYLIERSEKPEVPVNCSFIANRLDVMRLETKYRLTYLFNRLTEKYGSELFYSTEECRKLLKDGNSDVSQFKPTMRDLIEFKSCLYQFNGSNESEMIKSILSQQNIFHSDSIILVVLRFLLLRYSIICHLTFTFKCLAEKDKTNFSILSRLADKEIRLIPNIISAVEDLVDIGAKETAVKDDLDVLDLNKSVKSYSLDDSIKRAKSESPNCLVTSFINLLTYSDFKAEDEIDVRLLYKIVRDEFSVVSSSDGKTSILNSEFKKLINYSNSEIEKLIQETEKNGVTLISDVLVSDKLRRASMNCADLGTIECSLLNQLKVLYTEKHGFLFSKSKPLKCKNFYIHNTGRLVRPNGEVTDLDLNSNNIKLSDITED